MNNQECLEYSMKSSSFEVLAHTSHWLTFLQDHCSSWFSLYPYQLCYKFYHSSLELCHINLLESRKPIFVGRHVESTYWIKNSVIIIIVRWDKDNIIIVRLFWGNKCSTKLRSIRLVFLELQTISFPMSFLLTSMIFVVILSIFIAWFRLTSLIVVLPFFYSTSN